MNLPNGYGPLAVCLTWRGIKSLIPAKKPFPTAFHESSSIVVPAHFILTCSSLPSPSRLGKPTPRHNLDLSHKMFNVVRILSRKAPRWLPTKTHHLRHTTMAPRVEEHHRLVCTSLTRMRTPPSRRRMKGHLGTPEGGNRTPRSLGGRVEKLEANVEEMKNDLAIQMGFTREILVLLKHGQTPNFVSPVVGSNSAHGASNPRGATKETRSSPVTRSSKRANRTETFEGSDDPDYLPIETPPPSHEDKTFLSKRSNTKRTKTTS
ncbi:hypothetical protein PIB30_061345 [Stylosanthes scabra]|uniref:Uncharacterized protein n=1 Tax=Stylosanthes scabra TaxID=79078 RepID=A0ABU6ZJK6_9FABA|nr:hypothetical protein [Stylosanthes scabra]